MLKSLLIGLLSFPVLSLGSQNAILKLSKVLDLENMEVYDTHLVHAERVWEGQVKTGKIEKPCVDIFNLDGKFDKRIELNYSPTHIFPHGENSVVVTGKNSIPHWTTSFTKITLVKGGYQAKTVQFPEEYQIDHFVGDGKREIFALFGDRQLLGNLKGPWSQVTSEEVIGPHQMVLFDNTVYVLNNHNIMSSGFETISKVDLTTGKVKIVSGDKYRQGVVNLHYHKNSGLILFPEYLIGQLTLFDPKTDTIVGAIPIEDPRGLASFGNCIAVSSYEKRLVSFFDLSTKEHKLVSTWDLSPMGSTFKFARNIGMDERSGKLFARSTYLCTGCNETMSSVIMAEEIGQETKKACLGNSILQ